MGWIEAENGMNEVEVNVKYLRDRECMILESLVYLSVVVYEEKEDSEDVFRGGVLFCWMGSIGLKVRAKLVAPRSPN